ncbi:MAG: GH78 / CBM67 [uncultured Thermomicrobiales bacterium]|uniref:alpha-L-rhamnosidase n=1 Tax=uncultured Thermomicrobiales bacterium TaxID=1645740 RepID=A0A6J4V5M6_9BACT|nr:MAG: GH78 / CBM67 [uncultured Thermomicrobiales bacterium]
MGTDLRPTRLRCEYLVDPLGIDERAPRLSWELAAAGRGQRQTAYQVVVAAAATDAAAGRGDLWDSGRVAGDRTAHVAYAGAALRSGQACWWSVQAWDRDGEPSPWASPARWEMGLLEADDWRAAWVGLGVEATRAAAEAGAAGGLAAERDALVASPCLRRGFLVERPVRRARLHATARGVYEARVNGQRVGDEVLAPGWTDYRRRIQVQSFDVTDHLRQGENVLGAMLGTGWYAGYVGFTPEARIYGPAPRLLLQLTVEYEDGTVETVATDGAWRAAPGPIVWSDLLMGETFDARREAELAGWDAPGFDDGAWSPVVTEARDGTLLVAAPAQPVRVLGEVPAETVTEPTPGVFVVDLGQNIAGWVRLRVTGEAGTVVRLRFAERLNPDGTLYTTNLRTARQTDTYVLRGGGEETWEPRFTFHGFQYVELTGYPGVPGREAVTGVVVGSDTPPAGEFACSDELVNRLQRNIVWGQKGNFLSIPTDCPQRDERLGWLGDAQVFVRTAAGNADVAAFFTKWMDDVVDAQSPAGGFPNVAPRVAVSEDGAPAWGDCGVIVPWTLWRVYGDTRLVERHWDAMARWVAYLEEANPDGLWRARRGPDFGDWLSIGADTPKEVVATAYYALDAALMAELARAIGREEDGRRYDALFDHVRAAFNRAYVSADGRVEGGTQTAYLLALRFGLLPEGLRDAAADHLVADIDAKGWHLSTGFVGVSYLCPVLTEIGRTDVAYRLLLNETFPSWGYSIRQGATTIWERWDGWTAERGFQDPGMNSFNHYSLGSVGEWLYRTVAGIDVDPAGPGFARAVIRPRPGGGLTHARARYHSIRGPIASDWRAEGGRFRLRVEVPANVTATVWVPCPDAAEVAEGGVPADGAEGVRFLRREDGAAVFAVGSGRYDFEATTAVGAG